MKDNKKILFWGLIIFISILFPISLFGKVKKQINAEEVLQQGREAFLNYNFEEAAELYDQYRSLKTKSKEPLDEEFEVWESQLEIASSAIDRVQRIVIIDSISIPKNRFYQAYKLSPSAGNIGPLTMFNLDSNLTTKDIGFVNEERDYFIFPTISNDGDLVLKEGRKLLDNNWEIKEALEGDFERSGDYAFPFMSADGQTLYFSNNGDESMGGYDLFVAQKDAISGEYLQPLNLGMPFNSPYDDLMMAIDEENGLGWWASDRNSMENEIAVFIYLLDDIRKNYSPEEDNLIDYAMITDYHLTWDENKTKDYQKKLESLPKSQGKEKVSSKDFELDLGNNKIYTSFSDFRNRKAIDVMKQYLAKEKELSNKKEELKKLRSQFKTTNSVEKSILKAEKDEEELLSQLKSLRNEVIKIENSTR